MSSANVDEVIDRYLAQIALEMSNRYALVSYIRKLLGPEVSYVPILDDNQLIIGIGHTGKNVWEQTQDWKIVKQNSLNLKTPPPPDLFANYVKKDVFQKRATLCDESTELCNQQSRTISDQNAKFAKLNKELIDFRASYEVMKTALANSNSELEKLKLDIISKDKQITNLVADNAILKDAAIQNNKSLTSLIETVVHNMAQSSAFRRQLELTDPNNPLIQKSSPIRAIIADLAYETFLTSNDWNMVRDVGASFLSDKERFSDTKKIKLINEIFSLGLITDVDEFLQFTGNEVMKMNIEGLLEFREGLIKFHKQASSI